MSNFIFTVALCLWTMDAVSLITTIIVAVNNKPIAGVDDFNSAAGNSKDGQLLLQVQRGNGMFFLVLQ